MKSKIILFTVYFIFLAEILSLRACAYIDASATTYIIQIVAGVVVALGTVAGAVISKIKKKAKEKFNIDLEKKDDEDEIEIYGISDDDE